MRGVEVKGVIAGLVFAFIFHAALATMLLVYTSAKANGSRVQEQNAWKRRRGPDFEPIRRGPRGLDKLNRRLMRFPAVSSGERSITRAGKRRWEYPEEEFGFRDFDPGFGRRLRRHEKIADRRGLDWGAPKEEEIIEAMVIPRLGYKKPKPHELPKLVKYEQPERVEDGVNVTRENPNPKEIKFKAPKHKKAQYDRRRKKRPSLAELIDAPDDEDPRKRPTMLSEIIGSPDGSPWGTGTEFKPGSAYLAKVERALRKVFKVPVFMSKEELKKQVVTILIQEMDSAGRILRYRVKRWSRSQAFNTAALEAIKRFVPSEGGSLTLPPPPPEVLQMINRRGLLVRLEGRLMR